MTKNQSFERILNVNNQALEKNTGTDQEVANVNHEYYSYVLEVLFIMSMKISAMYKL